MRRPPPSGTVSGPSTLLGKRQKVVAGYLADTDVLGLYRGEVTQRGGGAPLPGGGAHRPGTWRSVPTAGEPAEEILSAFLVQYYTRRGRAAPADSPALEAMEGAADLGRLLSHQAGRKVELVTPQRGAKADLIRMAQENARTEVRAPDHPGGADRPNSCTLLAQLLELPGPPRRIEAYDISNTGAGRHCGGHDGLCEHGRPRKGAYRYFALRDLDGPDDYASMDQVHHPPLPP